MGLLDEVLGSVMGGQQLSGAGGEGGLGNAGDLMDMLGGLL